MTSAPSVPDAAAIERDERTYKDRNAKIAALMARMGYRPPHNVAERFAALEQQGAVVFGFARLQLPEQASAAAAQFAAAAEGLQRSIVAERQQRARAVEVALVNIAASSRSLIAWVCAAAAITGLLIGPMGLLLLRRVLARLQGIGWALLRLARNDTSIDIPGLTHQDEVGQLARSVAVFKAKSIELLHKKAELERLNLQLDAAINNMPLGLSMFDAQGRLLVCNKQFAEMYALPDELTRPGTVHCALWEYREKQGGKHYPSGSAELHARCRLPRDHDHRVRQRAHRLRCHASR